MRQALLADRVSVDSKHGDVVTAVAVAPERLGYAIAKRSLDVAFSAPALLLSAPILLLIAVLVRLDSTGPVLFRQARVGQGGRVFTFYKFRTMHVDARSRFPDLYAYRYTREEFLDMALKTRDDPRLTRLGRKLRKTSLDELPNLWNVLRGDMSLVGPRPELPEMVAYYTAEELSKFSVRPGVTGLWQVSGRANLRNGLQLANDVAYVRQRSFQFDLAILLKTVKVVILRVGAL